MYIVDRCVKRHRVYLSKLTRVQYTVLNPVTSLLGYSPFNMCLCLLFCDSGPESPPNVTIISIDILTANISWASPTSPHDGYEVYVTNLATGERVLKETITIADSTGHYVVTGLIPVTNYTFEVGTYLNPMGLFPLQRSDQDLNPVVMNQTGLFPPSTNIIWGFKGNCMRTILLNSPIRGLESCFGCKI